MKAVLNKVETYNHLSNIAGFAKCFPHLMNQLAKGKVWSWDNHGVTGTLTDEQVAYIEELEEQNAEYDLKVYAVLDDWSQMGGDTVHMLCYLFVTNEAYDISAYSDDTFYAMAQVVNETWSISEMGSVLIKRCVAGGPRRVG